MVIISSFPTIAFAEEKPQKTVKVGNVSYTDERNQKLLYSRKSMGTEIYNLYVLASRTDIDSFDLSTVNGKRIAVAKDSYQETLLENWLNDNHLSCEIVLVDSNKPEDEPLQSGEVDLCVTFDKGDMKNCYSIANLGSSDLYFAMPKKDSELMEKLILRHRCVT